MLPYSHLICYDNTENKGGIFEYKWLQVEL